MTIKNQMVKLHRWFGLVMCLFFLAWFISGFVMLYADFPQYSKNDRLAHLGVLAAGSLTQKPALLTRLLKQDTSWKNMRINRLLNRSVLRVEANTGALYSIYADTGEPVGPLSQADAETIAVNYLPVHDRPLTIEKIDELDQWIPRASFLPYMPAYRVIMSDPSGTILYISSKTGEIIQAHTRLQRILA